MISAPLTAAILSAAVLLQAVTALAASPQGQSPGQAQPGRPQAEPDMERLTCDDPGDVRCRSNPCNGSTEIYGYDEATCTPCLANSVAALSNRVCTCVEGYVETSMDTWGRATCVAAEDAAPPPALTDVVSVPAGEFLNTVNGLGFSPDIDPPPMMVCTVGVPRGGTGIQLHLVPPDSAIIFPTPYDRELIVCSVRLFGARLVDGWQFVGLSGVEISGCEEGSDFSASIAKRNGDPQDTTHDAELAAWDTQVCAITVDAVRLVGPSDQHWKAALGF